MANSGPSMAETRQLAWFIFWRFVIAALLAGSLSGEILGFIVGVIGGLTGHVKEAHLIASWGGGLVGLVASFFVLNWVLTRTIGRPIGGRELRLVNTAR